MQAMRNMKPTLGGIGAVRPMAYEDPIAEDDFEDVPVRTTARGLCRLVVVAAQTAVRFQSEGSEHDPMAWMLSPRRLFGGGNAIKACLEREPFMRTMLLHGLSLGLDADPDDLDDLFGDEREDEVSVAMDDPHESRRADGEARLYTAMIVHHGRQVMLHAFHASVASDAGEVAARLRARYGPAVASGARIVAGFDPTSGFAAALVTPAIGEMLRIVAADPTTRVAAGLDLNFEQRLDA